jgi:NTP pyrophosphatase (non-canonical NTP hydrolase)
MASPNKAVQEVLGYNHDQVAAFRKALFDLVQSAQRDSDRWFPEAGRNIAHVALALGGEVGEVQNIVKKIDRGTVKLEDVRAHLRDELADVFTYFLDLCSLVGSDILYDYFTKQTYNNERFSK